MKVNKYTTCLVKEKTITYPAEKADNAQAARDIVCRLFRADRLPSEGVWMICTNTKLGAVAAFEVGSGIMGQCLVDVTAIARNALLSGAAGVIMIHNHPSGDTSPSKEDVEATMNVKRALKVLGMQLLDHVIVGACGYYSFAEGGLL